MTKELSPQALTIITLLNNASELSVNHHEYKLARDVVRAIKKLCEDLGFQIENSTFNYILESIGSKPPKAMKEEFSRFADSIVSMDRKLDKEPLAGDIKNGPPNFKNYSSQTK